MPFFVKSNGPVVLRRGPFNTEQEANSFVADKTNDPLYQGHEFIVELESLEPARPRLGAPRPARKKSRPRGRSGGRGSGRSSGDRSSSAGKKRRVKRTDRRSSGRRR